MGKLFDSLEKYGRGNCYPYHMPGHKRYLNGALPEEIIKNDITEIDGFDNLHQPEGILRELQEKAAALYGAEESFYLVNGSTCGILSAISAALPRGGHLLMARNSHKSAYHAAYLRNLTISYLYPTVMKEYDICDVITAAQVRDALEQQPDIQAVFIVSPTYEGRIANIRELAELVHERGIPLIVDEAHGAHLGLGADHGNSCRAGADIVIHSVHKTLPAMTQTALLHVNGSLINRGILKRFLHIYQTSSPSYILMASIDNALQLVEDRGNELFANFKVCFTKMMKQLQKCKSLQFLPLDQNQDMGKLIISGKKAGISGQTIYNILLERYHLQLEMAAGSYCLAMFTIGDRPEGYERMTAALLEIDRDMTEGKFPEAACRVLNKAPVFEEKATGEWGSCNLQQSIPLSEAWDMLGEAIPLREAVGRHIADFVNLYPPGVPLLVPGEVLEKGLSEELGDYLAGGLNVQGIAGDAPNYTVKVLKDL